MLIMSELTTIQYTQLLSGHLKAIDFHNKLNHHMLAFGTYWIWDMSPAVDRINSILSEICSENPMI